MASVDELDLMMRSGLEALAPEAPADLEDIVVARVARRKQRRVTRNAAGGVFAMLLVFGVAGLFVQHDGQRVHVEQGPSGTKTHHNKGKGTKNDAPDGGTNQLQVQPGGGANGNTAGNGTQPGNGAVVPGGAPGAGSNTGNQGGDGSSQPGGGDNTPPVNDGVPKLVVTLKSWADMTLGLSQPSVPAGPVDVTFVNNVYAPGAQLQLTGISVKIGNGQTRRVTFGDLPVVQLGVHIAFRDWATMLGVTPPAVAPPTSPDTPNLITINVYDDHLELPNRGSATFEKMMYTTVADGSVTFDMYNEGVSNRMIKFDSIPNSRWRIRPGDHLRITVSLPVAGGNYQVWRAYATGTATESLLLGPS